METDLIKQLVEAIIPSYSYEKEKVGKDLDITLYYNLLNIPLIKIKENMHKTLLEWDSQRFEIIKGRSFIFLDKYERKIYVQLNENYLKNLHKKCLEEKILQYILGMALGIENESLDEYFQMSLFDATEYDDSCEELRKRAFEKYADFFNEYGTQYDKVYVITKNNSKNSPKILLYEITPNLELKKVDNWSRYIIPQNSDLNYNDVERKDALADFINKKTNTNKKSKTNLKDNVKNNVKNDTEQNNLD